MNSDRIKFKIIFFSHFNIESFGVWLPHILFAETISGEKSVNEMNKTEIVNNFFIANILFLFHIFFIQFNPILN
ncbi:hypothetical protein LPB138_00300 [Urechidicola croceus]|uniref:Uncharacterized protein n=1 Tax=Urechidicola croceus TaxID=1850246 RepID=A0A1D8P3R4_9FLAO|nr:hypothetical protein LPB138_00300 [Urechidicola croceus]